MTVHSTPASSNGTAAHASLDADQTQALRDLNQDILDALPMRIVVYKAVPPAAFRFIFANHAVFAVSGFTRDDLGRLLTELFPADQATLTSERFHQCLTTQTPLAIDECYTIPTGTGWFQSRYLPLPASQGQAARVVLMLEDITERKQRELAEREHQEALITHQAATLAELSTPLLAISDTTVVMPLIGTVDSRRVSQIMEALLSGVAEARATHVILDITGVQVVDTQVASAFIRAAQAVQLLGAQLILTGIRPEVAQTIVGLGTDLQGIVTRGSLQSGITYAMGRAQHR